MPRRLHALLLAAALGVIAVGYLARIDLWPNDAGYVYFTYARNFAAGHPFAYDARGIRSDGVASPLWLLMLVPFEWLGVNPYFSALLLSWLGLAASVVLWTAALYQAGWRDSGSLAVVAAATAHLLLADGNVSYLVTAGLETTWSPVFVLLGTLLGVRWLSRDVAPTPALVSLGLGCFLLAALVRPENAAAMAAMLAYLLAVGGRERRTRLLARLPAVGLAVLLCLLAKYAVFGGLLSNAYYRSVAGRTWPGLPYVAAYLKEYGFAWSGLALGLVVLALQRRSGGLRGWRPGETHAVVMLLSAGLANVLTGTLAFPLGGAGQRFHYLATFACFALLAALAGALLRELAARAESPRAAFWARAAAPLALALIAWGHFPSFAKAFERPEALRAFYARTVAATERHHYLRFGKHLRERVADHRRLVVAFGDPGALAYGLDGILVDTGGLTETALARLYREPDGPGKARVFVEHVLRFEPDLILLAAARPRAGSTLRMAPDAYSPFRAPDPGVERAYLERGYRYLCSLAMFTEVHAFVPSRSPRREALVRAVLEYAEDVGGYRLPGGLSLLFGAEAVAFPAADVLEQATAERAARLEQRARGPRG